MSYDDNRTGFTKRKREDDEYHNEPKPKFKAKSTMDRPHTVHVDGKAWKKFDNGHQAHAAAKTLEAKGKKATAIAHFKEEAVDESMTDSWKSVQSMDKGSVLSGKDGAKKRLAYLNAVHAHHKKYGNDTMKVKKEIESINRSRVAEEVESIEEATPYYNKPSFLKKMGRVAKQERLAREKKEKEAKPVKEDIELDEGLKPGWMLKADKNLATKLKAQLDRKKHVLGKPSPGFKPDEPKKKVSEEVKVSTNTYGKKSTKEVLNALSGKQDMSPVQQDISPDASKKPVGKVLSSLKGKQDMSPVKEPVKEGHVPDHSGVLNKKDSATMGKLAALMAKEKAAKKPAPVKEEIEQIDEKSEQAKKNKTLKNMMDASRGAKHKLNNPVPPAGPEHKTGQAHNKAIGRALRNEETDDLEEAKKEAAVMCANCDKPYHKGECAGEPEKELKEEEGFTLHSKETNPDGTVTIVLKSPSGKLIRHKGKGAAQAVKQRYGIQSGVQEETETLTKEDTMINSFKSYMQEDLDEAAWPGTPEYKKKFPEAGLAKGEKKKGAKGTITGTGTGVKHERDYEKAEKETGASETQEKRGRGRPKGSASGARQK